ncbi:uncharacterized protein DFL_009442 [Arthrobotrys flagrans]|uniref:Uncharacterized protein n=1 Tax=Arthrobotrys flagrans TaxID=97331 RepID=A0A436ZRQ2_ARTFL|nr:hypothetical protein DFL_009442 [Arthrobotrys flagrans]
MSVRDQLEGHDVELLDLSSASCCVTDGVYHQSVIAITTIPPATIDKHSFTPYSPEGLADKDIKSFVSILHPYFPDPFSNTI